MIQTMAINANSPIKVEFSFKVVDSMLNINGNKVSVRTPFAENGTTVVYRGDGSIPVFTATVFS